MSNLFNQALSAVVTLCGLGYVNWAVLRWLDVIEETEDKNYQLGLVSLLSVADWIIYLVIEATLVSLGLRGNGLNATAIFVTMVINFLLTLLLGQPVGKIMRSILNARRKSSGKSSKYGGSLIEDLLNDETQQIECYIYDFDHRPLGFGSLIGLSYDKGSDKELSLRPFVSESGEKQPSYNSMISEVEQSADRKLGGTTQYINFSKKFIMIVVKSPLNQ